MIEKNLNLFLKNSRLFPDCKENMRDEGCITDLLVKMHGQSQKNKQNKQIKGKFGRFLQSHLAKCTKEIKKKKIVCEHF